ncbi:MAG: hypothetical protein CMK53_09570 [Proteobacteria bacterium]|nr:hypothetical protein [Pseudomonadota bacterium]
MTVRRGIADLLEKLEEGKYWLTKVVDCTLSTFPEALGLSYLKLHNQFIKMIFKFGLNNFQEFFLTKLLLQILKEG